VCVHVCVCVCVTPLHHGFKSQGVSERIGYCQIIYQTEEREREGGGLGGSVSPSLFFLSRHSVYHEWATI